jgi:RNA polymerase sigma factor (TIGR02999 family)
VPRTPDITELLLRWNRGDTAALEQLTPVVYDELRLLARAALRRERPDHTLSATALVHEAYLKLVDQHRAAWENRAHFFGAASKIMRRILVDHARARAAGKRGGAAVRAPLEMEQLGILDHAAELLELDEALERLAEFDARKARVVEMRFFGGMTFPEIAAALSVSLATVERDWKMARAWLLQAISPPAE